MSENVLDPFLSDAQTLYEIRTDLQNASLKSSGASVYSFDLDAPINADMKPMEAVARVKHSKGPEVVCEIIENPNKTGGVLLHLVSNRETYKRVEEAVLQDPESAFSHMISTSDPQLKAAALLSEKSSALRPKLVALALDSLKLQPVGLNVVLRACDGSTLSQADLASIAHYTQRSTPTQTKALATAVIAKVLSKTVDQVHSLLAEYLADPAQVAAAYALISAVFKADISERRSIACDIFSKHALWTEIDNDEVVLSCLDMLSGAVTAPDARNLVVQRFDKMIMDALTSTNTNHKITAANVRIALLASGFTQLEPAKAADEVDMLADCLTDAIIASNPEYLEYAVVGLACASLLPSVCAKATPELIKALVPLVKAPEESPTLVYAALSVLANITVYPFKDTQQERRAKELRQSTKKPLLWETQEKLAAETALRNINHLLKTGLVEWLSQACSRYSLASRKETVRLVYNLSSQPRQETRVELASQGGLVVALYLWLCTKPVSVKLDEATKCVALAAVSKMLVSVPPPVAFTPRFPVKVVVEPLLSQINNQHSSRPNQDTLEALMALTNIASEENDDVRVRIVTRGWPRIEACLSSEYVQIQRSTFELICNLMLCVQCACVFLQRTNHSKALQTILGKALESDDERMRIAVSGALAILVEWETAPETLSENRNIISSLLAALKKREGDVPFLERAISFLHTFLKQTLKQQNDEIAEYMIHYGGIDVLQALLDSDEESSAMLDTKLLMCLQLLIDFKGDKKS